MRIVPLGGLGEIGRNMNVIEYNGHILLIDCGVLFPEEEQPGVDLILPDFSYIKDKLDRVDALVLTHGHEDHIGGVPYLLRLRPDIPLIGSKLTLGFVDAKCEEHHLKPREVEVKGRDKLKVGPFSLEFVAVTRHRSPAGRWTTVRCPHRSRLFQTWRRLDQAKQRAPAPVRPRPLPRAPLPPAWPGAPCCSRWSRLHPGPPLRHCQPKPVFCLIRHADSGLRKGLPLPRLAMSSLRLSKLELMPESSSRPPLR